MGRRRVILCVCVCVCELIVIKCGNELDQSRAFIYQFSALLCSARLALPQMFAMFVALLDFKTLEKEADEKISHAYTHTHTRLHTCPLINLHATFLTRTQREVNEETTTTTTIIKMLIAR